MVDDDVSTLLKLDEKGFHAGGTVQAGSRPLFVASGGFTVNPPDLTSAGDRLRTLLANARDTVQEAAHDLPDPSPTVGDAIEALRSAVADLRSDLPDGSDLRDAIPDVRSAAPDLRNALPDLRASAAGLAAEIPNALPSPDPDRLAADARDLTNRARLAVGLAPRSMALADRIPRWLPGGLLAVGAVAAAGAVIVLWDPVHGARRRRRLIARVRLLRSRILGGGVVLGGAGNRAHQDTPATTTRIDPVAIPVTPDHTPIVGVHLRD